MLLSFQIPCFQLIRHRGDDDQHRSFDVSFEVRHGNIHWLHFPSSHSSYLPTSNMASYTTPDSSNSQSSSASSSSYSSYTCSPPPIGAPFLESTTASLCLSDSGSSSIRTRSTIPRRRTRQHRRSRPSRHGDHYRRRSSLESVGGRSECSHGSARSFDSLFMLPWSRLNPKSKKLPSNASWVVSFHQVEGGRRR
jgi:hypothetical protein